MRSGNSWVDVSIRNLSSRGMMIDAEEPVERGSYVEIRRGAHVVIGRAVWRKGRNLGVHAQDRINLDAIISRPNEAAAVPAGEVPERRATPRSRVDPERSARMGKHIQAAGLGLAALAAAFTVAHTAHQSLKSTFSTVKVALVNEEHKIEAELGN